MQIGTSILLIAVGAILRYAVNATVSWIDLDTVGLILIIVGVVGLVISLLYMALWADRTGRRAIHTRTRRRPATATSSRRSSIPRTHGSSGEPG